MGCTSSKVVDTGPRNAGYGMGTSPAYTGIRSSSKKPVLIVWDMDDIVCPPDNALCLQFLNLLHEEFVTKHSRIESQIVAVYGSGRELNMSKEATDLRVFLKSENVELKSSDGPTVTAVDQVIMDFAVNVPRGSTIVIIGNVAEYHEACLYARKKGLFVERILSADGLHRLAEACHANWMCSLAEFLSVNGIKDWRKPAQGNFRSSSITFRSASIVIVPDSEGMHGLPSASNAGDKAKKHSASHASEAGTTSLHALHGASVMDTTKDADVTTPLDCVTEHCTETKTQDSPQCPAPTDSAADATTSNPTTTELASTEDAADRILVKAGGEEAEEATVEASRSTLLHNNAVRDIASNASEPGKESQEASIINDAGMLAPNGSLGTDLEDDVVNLAVDTALENVANMISCDMASAPGEAYSAASEDSEQKLGGYDSMVERAVRASEYMGASEEAADIARKSERLVRPSMAVSMFRGRRHIAATINPDADSDEEVEMEILPMDSTAHDEDDEEAVHGENCFAPDPMMTWKAQVLRALRAANDFAITVTSLAALAPNPIVGTPYCDHLNAHLISRNLAKWVVEDESIQLIA